jgi:hypothetical protein
MKTKKNIYIILTTIFAISALSYGFFKTHITSPPPPLSPQEAILGVWKMEDEPGNKIEFLTDGHVKTYIDGILEYDEIYTFPSNCDNLSTNTNQLFLKLVDTEDGKENCFIVFGINVDDSGVLSLMDDNGRMIIYARP